MINYRSLVRGSGVAGSTCGPVKAEIAGSNPVAPARKIEQKEEVLSNSKEYLRTSSFVVESWRIFQANPGFLRQAVSLPTC